MKNHKHTTVRTRLKKGDTVRILSGKDRGKQGPVLAVLTAKKKKSGGQTTRRVLVDGINLVKKHVRPKRSGEKGQRVTVAAPLPASRVQLICPSCKKGTRIGVKRDDGVRQRVCKKCEAVISEKS